MVPGLTLLKAAQVRLGRVTDRRGEDMRIVKRTVRRALWLAAIRTFHLIFLKTYTFRLVLNDGEMF